MVLNWNNGPDTLECLESLYPLLDRQTRLIVCDNASDDDSPARIAAWAASRFPPADPRFALLQTGANRGFAGGMNAGIRHALADEKLAFIWLLNNDTVVAADALAALRACAQAQAEVALFGSSILEYGREILQCAGGCRYYPLLTVFRNACAGLRLEQVGEAPRLDYVYGAAMFLRAEAVRRIGLLNEEYFLFYEELDYTRRLRQAGYAIAWCRDSRVYHKGSASVGKPGQASRAKRVLANYHENLSTLKYTANFHPRLLWPVLVLRFSLKSLVLLVRREFFLLPPLWRAYRDFFRQKRRGPAHFPPR